MSHTREDEERLFKRINETSARQERERKMEENNRFNKLMGGTKPVYTKRKKSIKNKVTTLFKKWIVKRPGGQCQILFALTELDDFVDDIIKTVKKL